MDRDAAVAAEAARNEKAGVGAAEEGNRDKWPQAEALRMGWMPYISAGTYQLVLTQGERTVETKLEVKAPASRVGKKKKKDHGRPPAKDG